MANVYYKLNGDYCYYTNEEKEGYSLWARGSEVATDHEVKIELYNGKFILPSDATKMFGKARNTEFDYMGDGDTSECTDMFAMFGYCANVTKMSFANWDTSNVTNMASMLGGMYAIKSLNLSTFDWRNCESTTAMFMYDNNLEEILAAPNTDLWSKDAPKVRSSGNMFYGCTKLPNFNSSSVDLIRANNTGNGAGPGYFGTGYYRFTYKCLEKYDDAGHEVDVYTKLWRQWGEAEVYM